MGSKIRSRAKVFQLGCGVQTANPSLPKNSASLKTQPYHKTLIKIPYDVFRSAICIGTNEESLDDFLDKITKNRETIILTQAECLCPKIENVNLPNNTTSERRQNCSEVPSPSELTSWSSHPVYKTFQFRGVLPLNKPTSVLGNVLRHQAAASETRSRLHSPKDFFNIAWSFFAFSLMLT